MKQVLQARNSSASVRDVPCPPCLPGGVLVRAAYSVISSGTERSRVELSQKSLIGKARERPDLVREVIGRAQREGLKATRAAVTRKLGEETPVGYSCAGRVIEVGEHVRGLRPGDAVACAGAGHANHAEVVSVPANLCAAVPDGVSLRDAAFTTIAAIALQGIRLADARLGERVAVIGCGLVGQITIRLLRSAGVETYAVEIDQARLEDARRGGAHHAFAPSNAARGIAALTGGVGVDAALVTAAAHSSDPLHLAAEIARDRGSVVLVGAVPIEMQRGPLYEKELSFRISRSYGPGRYDREYEERGLDYPIGYVRWTEQRNMMAVLDLLARGALQLEDLVEDELPVDRAGDAYARLVDSDTPLRGALVLSYPEQEVSSGDSSYSVVSSAPTAGQAGRAATARSSDELRVGLIGPGSFASRVILPALIDAGARPEAVAGGSGPSAGAAARRLGFSRVLPDPHALIRDDAIDLVVVCTRHGSHAQLVVEALNAGKHVFCEKPLALTQDDLVTVIRAASESRGILAVGFNRRFSPLLRAARDFLARPGERMTVTYRVAAGRLASDHWVNDLTEGGGRALGEGCHFIDCLSYLTASPVVSIHAAGYSSDQLPVQAWDNLVITLGFENGCVGTVTYVADGSSDVAKERLEAFSGTRTAILDDYRQLVTYDGHTKRTIAHKTQDKGHRAEIASFLAGAQSGSPPVPLDAIANVSLATLAIVESLRTGSAITLASPARTAGEPSISASA
jgi:predicted dehydrogenase/threonine dehydrogenase-like Zn-dependent dehydrogenase